MDKNINNILKNIEEIVKIKSVYDETTKTKTQPFGKGVNEAFMFMKKLAETENLKFVEYDGYASEIIIGNGPKTIAILCHLDVVPAQNEDMYQIKKMDDALYGRGAADDKGPTIVAFEALKQAYKDNKLNTKDYTYKLIMGGAEETTWECMEKYFSVNSEPDFAFAPDAEFPVVQGEKGIVNLLIDIDLEDTNFKDVKNEATLNIISDEGILNFENKIIEFKGKSVHSSLPEEGENPYIKGLEFIYKNTKSKNKEQILAIFNLVKNYYLEDVGLSQTHPKLGKTTGALTKFEINNNVLNLGINFRTVQNENNNEFISQITAYLKNNSISSFEFVADKEPLFFDDEHPLVKTLINVYENITMKKDQKPICIGGTTYAKATKNCVAFGPFELTDKNFIHQAQENIKIETIKTAYLVYYNALIELGKINATKK